jgi:hypothetical protein
MGKPWARYEIGFIKHDKFRAISSNAICLWLEGKDYADTKLTDGLLPDYEVKHWRFYSKKSVELLTHSCGVKPGTQTAYAPLWEVVEGFGFKMHDYLDHNPSRDETQARLAEKEKKREADRERLKRWRDAKRHGDETQDETRFATPNETVETLYTEDRSQITDLTVPKERERKPTPDGGGKRPIYQSDRFVVFEWQHDEIEKMLGPHFLGFDIHAFWDELTQRSRAQGLVIPADREARWKWLQAQVEVEARKRGLPMASTDAAPTNKRIDALARGTQKALERMTMR